MRREPPITFRGALQILGHYDRPWLDRLDRLLGGVILASGVVPAVSAVFGWVDQKNQATGLLRHAFDFVSNRLTTTGGLARYELAIAAHTTLVVAAFFDTLRGWLGQQFADAAFTEAEKVMLSTGKWQHESESLVRHLYEAAVPAPSATRGFHENATQVRDWAWRRVNRVAAFLKDIGIEPEGLDAAFARAVTDRYRSDYLALVTAVPEFRVWADLGEHAATRTALTRLEGLLSHPTTPTRDLRALLGETNRSELTRPMIDIDIDGYGIDAVFPTVERIFLTPRVRVTAADRSARIGDERWWDDQPVSHDLDLVLARHFSTPDSTRLPLLLLGHPGAGKSLLMKVLAARLPETTYTVVRVPLRRVDADAHVSTQVQQALAAATHGRVLWHELVDQSADAIRVILLDGLDELLQATTNDRAGYLTDIAEFQRIEEAMGKPVAVVVTSRTLVADRVRVQEGTPVLKLEEFDESQIYEWLRIWHEVNSGTRPVSPESVLSQGELARQPLLLLMLTLYFADPNVTPTDAELSTLELYERLFGTYARREVIKQADRVLPEAELGDAVDAQLNRLSIAAMGMFNRGRQSVTEPELSADLTALGEPAPAGRRLLGEFFFVHAPEAMTGEVQRGYEFLHATFAEYLVATKVVEVLSDVVEGTYGRRRYHEPDDELLFGLLSYQPLAVQRPILDFVAEHFARMNEKEREHISRILERLVSTHRHRRIASRHTDYRPQPPDTVRALAAYSANLVLLRLHVDPTAGVALTTMWPGESHAWPRTMSLWESGLDAEGYRAVLSHIERNGDSIFLKRIPFGVLTDLSDVHIAQLRDDAEMARRLQFGHAALGNWVLTEEHEPNQWADYTLNLLLRLMLGHGSQDLHLMDPPGSVPTKVTCAVAEVTLSVLGLRCAQLDRDETKTMLRWLMRLELPGMASLVPFALVEHTHPGILGELRDQPSGDWAEEWRLLLGAVTPDALREMAVARLFQHLTVLTPAWILLRQPQGHVTRGS